jgi:hypothetical protein
VIPPVLYAGISGPLDSQYTMFVTHKPLDLAGRALAQGDSRLQCLLLLLLTPDAYCTVITVQEVSSFNGPPAPPPGRPAPPTRGYAPDSPQLRGRAAFFCREVDLEMGQPRFYTPPPACVFVFCLHWHSPPPARVSRFIRRTSVHTASNLRRGHRPACADRPCITQQRRQREQRSSPSARLLLTTIR